MSCLFSRIIRLLVCFYRMKNYWGMIIWTTTPPPPPQIYTRGTLGGGVAQTHRTIIQLALVIRA